MASKGSNGIGGTGGVEGAEVIDGRDDMLYEAAASNEFPPASVDRYCCA